MSDEFETFLLYYTEWHERGLTLGEMKSLVIADVGEDAFRRSISEFRSSRLKREAAGDFRTLYDLMVA